MAMEDFFAKLWENGRVVIPTVHRQLIEMFLDPMELSATNENHVVSV